jgi:hypothetical protein
MLWIGSRRKYDGCGVVSQVVCNDGPPDRLFASRGTGEHVEAQRRECSEGRDLTCGEESLVDRLRECDLKNASSSLSRCSTRCNWLYPASELNRGGVR